MPPPPLLDITSDSTTYDSTQEQSPISGQQQLSADPVTATPTYRPDPANTRVLLRSLEELRDSLSVRVEQLSLAVERLRGQASELERVVTSSTSLTPEGQLGAEPLTDSRFEPLPLPLRLYPRRRTLSARASTTTPASITTPGSRDVSGLNLVDPVGAASLHTLTTADWPRDIPIPSRDRDRDSARDRNARRQSLAARLSFWRHHLQSVRTIGDRDIERSRAMTSESQPNQPFTTTMLQPTVTRGRTPTNLKDVASQPQPVVVRSPAASEEPESSQPSISEIVNPDVTYLDGALDVPEGSSVPIRSSSSGRPELLNVAQPFWAERQPPQPSTTRLRHPNDGLRSSGLTSLGMRVRARQGVSSHDSDESESSEGETVARVAAADVARSRAARDRRLDELRERRATLLDREILVHERRFDATQREWEHAWQAERLHTIQSGATPNEYTADRLETMRRHVDTAHRLWELLQRRAQQSAFPAGAPSRLSRDDDGIVQSDALRHIIGVSPSFLRTRQPAASPPNDTGALADLEQRWIERIQRERSGLPTTPTADQAEFSYYRDFLYDRRQRTSASRLPQDELRGEATGEGTDDSWPSRRLELLELIAQSRAHVRQVRAAARDLSPVGVRDDAPITDAHEPVFPESLASATNDRSRARTGPVPLLDDDETWQARRSALLEFIEQSRARVHEMARELSPDVLEEERPGMRRVLQGLERMLANGNISIDMRDRIERLAARERELLGEAPPGSSSQPATPYAARRAPTPPPTGRDTGARERPADVLERIERTRERVRELSRISADLAVVRAGMGLGDNELSQGQAALERSQAELERRQRELERLARSRRASDAETVVPLREFVGEEAAAAERVIESPSPAIVVFGEGEPASGSRVVLAELQLAVPRVPDISGIAPSAAGSVIATAGDEDADERESLSSSASSSISGASSAAQLSHRGSSGIRASPAPPPTPKEAGELNADVWPVPVRPATPENVRRPYVSILDLE